ncbi:MAG: hypothetical protein ACI97N_002320 [Cognaticolwellia sp.]
MSLLNLKFMTYLKLSFFGVALFLVSSCTKDTQPDCKNLYPEYEGTIDTSVFDFQWCAIQGATHYRVKVEGTFYPFDTIVEGTSMKSMIQVPDANNPNIYLEISPFQWGENYEWQVAPIIDGQQGEWSEVYTFQTWDARDKIIGTYTLDKYIYKYSLSGYSYLSNYLGEGQVKVEKVESTRNIRITEIGGNNSSEELRNLGSLSSWSKTYDVYPYKLVAYPNDSIKIIFMTNPADSIPWGYYYGGYY